MTPTQPNAIRSLQVALSALLLTVCGDVVNIAGVAQVAYVANEYPPMSNQRWCVEKSIHSDIPSAPVAHMQRTPHNQHIQQLIDWHYSMAVIVARAQ